MYLSERLNVFNKSVKSSSYIVRDFMKAGAPMIRCHVLPHTLGCSPHIVQLWAGVMLSYGGSWSFTALLHWGVKSVT